MARGRTITHTVSLAIPHSSRRIIADKYNRIRQDRQKDPAAPKQKPDTHRTKQIYDSISAIFDALIPAISANAAADQHYLTGETWNLMKAYIPDMILAYLSVLQSASWFLNKEPAVKAMEVAVLVADGDNEWVQKCLLETGRMSEVVDCLAQVSRAMLKLGAGSSKDAMAKKRGGKGETLRLWDLGAR
jgi:nuclear pore complex protein Nup107